MLSAGLKNNPSTSVQICYPSGTSANQLGDPVRVQIQSTFNVLPLVGAGTLHLKAKATMRLEHSQEAGKGGLITGTVACT
jgi:hypothetical protein